MKPKSNIQIMGVFFKGSEFHDKFSIKGKCSRLLLKIFIWWP